MIVEIVSEGVYKVDGLVSCTIILKMTRKEYYSKADEGERVERASLNTLGKNHICAHLPNVM